MTDPKKTGAFGVDNGLDAGPEQGGSNMGGLGSTGAMDRDRDPVGEGIAKPGGADSSREMAIEEAAGDEEAPEGK